MTPRETSEKNFIGSLLQEEEDNPHYGQQTNMPTGFPYNSEAVPPYWNVNANQSNFHDMPNG